MCNLRLKGNKQTSELILIHPRGRLQIMRPTNVHNPTKVKEFNQPLIDGAVKKIILMPPKKRSERKSKLFIYKETLCLKKKYL